MFRWSTERGNRMYRNTQCRERPRVSGVPMHHVFRLIEPWGLIVIVVRSDLCFQERARSRIGGSPEEALHDRGVFSGHYDECCGPGACQGILNPKATITRILTPSISNILTLCPLRGRSCFLFPSSFLRGYLLNSSWSIDIDVSKKDIYFKLDIQFMTCKMYTIRFAIRFVQF